MVMPGKLNVDFPCNVILYFNLCCLKLNTLGLVRKKKRTYIAFNFFFTSSTLIRDRGRIPTDLCKAVVVKCFLSAKYEILSNLFVLSFPPLD